MNKTDGLLAGDRCYYVVRDLDVPEYTAMTLGFDHYDINSFFEPKIYMCFGVIRNGIFHYVD